MSHLANRPNPEPILDSLKDFQRNTVEYVFRRLYLDDRASDRFLVADEVGLGKTLVARGLIAKAIHHLWDKVDRIDILYICSNADIARQNIRKLKVSEGKEFSLASRITLLPLHLKNLQDNKVNFISFTPSTSFDLRSSLGTQDERALLYWLLHHVWDFGDSAAPKNIFQGNASVKNFRGHLKLFCWNHGDIDESLAEGFRQKLLHQIAQDQKAGKPDLHSRFLELREAFQRARDIYAIPWEQKQERSRFIGDLRLLLAKSCIAALEPDLIILDEFQRFKHLLKPENDFNEIAHALFTYADEQSTTKVVMLSATPYKMYTLSHESEEDNHYEDFLQTIQFLQADDAKTEAFRRLLSQYRCELFRLGQDTAHQLLDIKAQLETQLRHIMVRTERLAASPDRDGMLVEMPCRHIKLEAQDLEAYLQLQQVAQVLNQHDTLEYWKSAPYLLNFMDNYELKRSFNQALDNSEQMAELAGAIAPSSPLLLPGSVLSSYSKLDPGNARLRDLIASTVDTGAWKLLWIPPSLPYYPLGGAFADEALAKFTKRLVFSSWRVVPKVIATLVSYEAERRMIRSFEKKPKNTPQERKRRRPLLRFARQDGRLTGMSVLALFYPCVALARECDPLAFALQYRDSSSSFTLEHLLQITQQKIETLLQNLKVDYSDSGNEDDAWYWLAPLLLDFQDNPTATQQWFSTPDLATVWAGKNPDSKDEKDDSSVWVEHVNHAREIVEGPIPTLGKPPADLARVLAQLAIAGPAIAALRSLTRISGGSASLSDSHLRTQAAQIGWSFRSLFNAPEAIALLRGSHKDEAYWRSVLEYCTEGGLQAVLDEYVHTLRDSLGLIQADTREAATKLAEAISNALTLRTSVMGVDDIHIKPKRGIVRRNTHRMRGHFAVRFGEEQNEEEKNLMSQQSDGKKKTLNRKEQVREAFNSPFRPFVLATTSVGQEGLDFHPYCHAVVHWNLPSNPVDMEQREGRVHRFKGHAVRKNLAQKYGVQELNNPDDDPWAQIFAAGLRDRPPGSSDLIPFWIYPLEDGAKIERYVPNLPLSRDCERLESLRRSLAIYRMVFGQSRQEDLLAYLSNRVSTDQAKQLIEMLQINLEPTSPGLL